MPRADDFCDFDLGGNSFPTTRNPLGVKGVGEAATTAAIATVMNAIADAVPGGGADDLDMPATPQKVWAACRKSG